MGKKAISTEIAKKLIVLSDPTRLAILNLLMQGVQCNCELGDNLGLPMNLVSHHLKVLRASRLVDAERDAIDARWIYYSVNVQVLQALRDELSAFLDPRRIQARVPVCGPRALAAKGMAQCAAKKR